MKDFVTKVLSELKSDSTLNENSLVRLVVESTNKAIANRESYENVYNQLKTSLVGINEHLKNEKINVLLGQFTTNERTTDSIINGISKVGNLKGKLNIIKESTAYSNPIIKSKVDNFEIKMNEGSEYRLYPAFISEMTPHMHEKSVKSAVDQMINVLENKGADLELLNTIEYMASLNSPIYESIIGELKTMLAENTYSADIINLKFGNTNFPMINQLVNSLKIAESKKSDGFTLGLGNSDTRITNLIAPSERTKNGIIIYADDRFIRISESTETDGSELELHVNEGFTIATLNPEYVRVNHEKFYNLSESFARLGFKSTGIREGVESKAIRNFKLGLNVNESGDLDIYLNDNKINGLDSINLTEALVMETPDIKNRVQFIFENLSSIVTFEFIKNVTNDRMLSDAIVFNLSENYIVCNKKNAVERVWNIMNEEQMFNFFNESFQYDISPIFGTKINEQIEERRKIEEAKAAIQENISKLEGSVAKLDESISANEISADDAAKLETLKTSINESIAKLKEEYIELDLARKQMISESEEEEDEEESDDITDELNNNINKYANKYAMPNITSGAEG